MSPWTREQRQELRDAIDVSRLEAEWELTRRAAFTIAGLLLEAVTELEILASDLDDPAVSMLVGRLRPPAVQIGDRLARMRAEAAA